MIRFQSVCSGIEAASVAWSPLGWQAVGFAEVEAFPSAVLAHHYPDVPNLGDITKFKDWPDAAFDLLVGGTPCQSFSVAGLRKGMADPRGNLALTYLAIADRYRPEWLVWENVPGVLSSSGGRDFGAFLGGLAELGYGFAYRVLDAQFVRVDGFGRAVPQRRRRVFVVGNSRDWRRAAAVLFEPESLSGNPAPRRQAGQAVTSGLGAGSKRSGGRLGRREAAGNQLVAFGGNDTSGPIDVATARNAHGGPHGRLDFESETFVALDLRNGTQDDVAMALQSGGMGDERGLCPNAIPHTLSVAKTLTRGAESSGKGGYAGRRQEDDDNLVASPIPIDMRQASRGDKFTNNRAAGSSGGAPGTGIGEAGDPSPTLADSHTPAIAFTQNSRSEVREIGGDGSVVGALAAEPGAQQQNYVAGPLRSHVRNNSNPTTEAAMHILDGWAVRRLTPTECARLQGFPDDYLTQVTWRGKSPPPDGPMYKALGNSFAVNVARWIGRRIQMVQDMCEEVEGEKVA